MKRNLVHPITVEEVSKAIESDRDCYDLQRMVFLYSPGLIAFKDLLPVCIN